MKFCAFRATRQIVDPLFLSFRGVSQRHEILQPARARLRLGGLLERARAPTDATRSTLRSKGAPAGDRLSFSVRSRLGVEEQFSLV